MNIGLVLDITTVFLYFLTLMLIGGYFYLTRNKSADEFMDGGRSFSGGIISISIFTTWMSNLALVSIPAMSCKGNWSYLMIFMALPFTSLLVAKFLIPVFRKEGSISAYTILSKRFGPWSSLYCSILYTITNIVRLAIIIYLCSASIGFLTGYEEKVMIFIIGGIAALYTFIGGLKCVIWTDLLQAFFFVLGAVVIFSLLIFYLPMDIDRGLLMSLKENKFSFGSTNFNFIEPTIWLFLVHSVFSTLQGMATEQSFVQRYVSARSEKDAQRGIFVGSILITLFAVFLLFIGTLLYISYSSNLEMLQNEQVVFHFIAEKVPYGLKGLIIVAILSAAMSSIDSEINSIATLFYNNVYKEYVCKNPNDEKSLSVLYKASLVVGIIPIILAFKMVDKSNYLDIWDNFDSLVSGGLLGLFLLLLFCKKAKKVSAIVGIASSALLVLWLVKSSSWGHFIPKSLISPLHPKMNIVLASLAIPIVGWITTLIVRKKEKVN